MTIGAFDVQPDQLKTVARDMSTVGKDVAKQSESLLVKPDGGGSSLEIAAFFSDLAAVASGSGQVINELSAAATAAATRYSAVDESVGERFTPPSQSPGPSPVPPSSPEPR